MRSVLKQIHHRRKDVLTGASTGQNCASVASNQEEAFVFATKAVTCAAVRPVSYGIHAAVNSVASSGAKAVGVMLTIFLPPEVREEEIRGMMQDAERTCEALGIEILGSHPTVTDAVHRPVLSVSGTGKVKKDSLQQAGNAKPGQEIVITKWVGLEATALLASEREQELKKRFPAELIETAEEFAGYLSAVKEASAAQECGANAMYALSEGGVFAALWEMASAAGVGMDVDLKKIPIRQETVEICEYFGINPYQILSSGSMMIAADNGWALVRELEKSGIPAAVIGTFTSGNDRIIRNGGECRYLDKPQMDEIYKVMEQEIETCQS